jgi:hypothetical protein
MLEYPSECLMLRFNLAQVFSIGERSSDFAGQGDPLFPSEFPSALKENNFSWVDY